MSALDLLAALVLSTGERWGDVAQAWQWADARAILDGPQRLAYITRPRGASKTTDLAAVAIVALAEQLPPASRSYAVAADKDQAALLLDAIAGFVNRTPGLRAVLRVDAWKVTHLSTGATLEVLAADAAGAFGSCRTWSSSMSGRSGRPRPSPSGCGVRSSRRYRRWPAPASSS